MSSNIASKARFYKAESLQTKLTISLIINCLLVVGLALSLLVKCSNRNVSEKTTALGPTTSPSPTESPRPAAAQTAILNESAFKLDKAKVNSWKIALIKDAMTDEKLAITQEGQLITDGDTAHPQSGSLLSMIIRGSRKHRIEVFFASDLGSLGFNDKYPVLLRFDKEKPVRIDCSGGTNGALFVEGDQVGDFVEACLNSKEVILRFTTKDDLTVDTKFDLAGLSQLIGFSNR